MGSVKDLEVLTPPEPMRTGVGRFHFSDRYSVFDWGAMPDLIPGRGQALCVIGAFFFQRMAERGIPTHYLGVGSGVSLEEVQGGAPQSMMVKLVRVIPPKYQGGSYRYEVFRSLSGNYLIPLEVIFRYTLPPGSSVFKRLEKGQLTPKDLGVDRVTPGMRLPRPVLDFSTKLEDGDRYLSPAEALMISGLNPGEFTQLKEMALLVAELIRDCFRPLRIMVEDGKLEFALTPERTLMVVDVAGTPDECRLRLEGIPLSKELVRAYYRDTPWYKTLEEEKQRGGTWRNRVPSPPRLPKEWCEGIRLLYQGLANAITGLPFFPDADLARVLPQIRLLWGSVSQ